MLSSSELSLCTIISDESKSFEDIANAFQKTYQKMEQFKVGITLWFLIKENLLNLSQRLASFYIMVDMCNTAKITANPFAPIILETLQKAKNKYEKKFLMDCLSSKLTYKGMTIKEFKDDKDIEDITVPDLTEYWDEFNKAVESFGKNINDWIRPIIYDTTKNGDKVESNDLKPPFDFTQLSAEELGFNYFEPNYLTYYPNANYPFLEDEPMWIMPTINYDFIWDFTMTPEQDNLANILNKKDMTQEQINYALELIDKNQNILKEINFTPECLMQLIENNPTFACDILLKISKHGNYLQEYIILYYIYSFLMPFLEKDLTTKSIMVLNKIIYLVEIPHEFIKKYLYHGLTFLLNDQNKEEQNTFASEIAIFISNLIDIGTISEYTQLPMKVYII